MSTTVFTVFLSLCSKLFQSREAGDPLAAIRAEVSSIAPILRNISDALVELVSETRLISDTIVFATKYGPALESDGHVESAAKAIQAGEYSIALTELQRAETLSPTNSQVWFGYCCLRLALSSQLTVLADLTSRVRRINHKFPMEVRSAARFLNVESPDGALKLFYGLFGLSLTTKDKESAIFVAEQIARRVTSCKDLSTKTINSYFRPLFDGLGRGQFSQIFAVPLTAVQRQYTSQVTDALRSIATEVSCYEKVDIDEKMAALQREAGEIQDFLELTQIKLLDPLQEIAPRVRAMQPYVAEIRQLYSEVWNWDGWEGSEESEGLASSTTLGRDTRWVIALVIGPVATVWLLPFRWWVSLLASGASLFLAWRLHRRIYSRPVRQFYEKRMPEIKSRLKEIETSIAPLVTATLQVLPSPSYRLGGVPERLAATRRR